MLPDLSRVPVFYHKYIAQVKETGLVQAFETSTPEFLDFIHGIPAHKHDYRYAEGKWTIKEMLQHIVDAERIFGYRALCFARKDETSLPGFDENTYADHAKADKRDWDDLLAEFKAVRMGSHLMFASFDEDQLDSTGIANNNPVYVLAIGYILIGHCTHHMNVIKERYL